MYSALVVYTERSSKNKKLIFLRTVDQCMRS